MRVGSDRSEGGVSMMIISTNKRTNEERLRLIGLPLIFLLYCLLVDSFAFPSPVVFPKQVAASPIIAYLFQAR